MMTLEPNYCSVLIHSMESTNVDEGPRPGSKPAMAIYYVIFFIIFPFFFVNIFVALIIITFQQQGDTELEDQNLDKNQKQCIDFVVNAKPMDKYVPRNKLGNQHRIWVIVNSWPFDFFIMLIIALNTIVLMTKYHKEDEDLTPLDHLFKEKILNYVNIVFTSVFTIECALKIYAFNPKNYFRDAWNAFDFITVVGSIVDIFVSNYSSGASKNFNLGFLRLFRAARLIKLLRQSYTIRTLLWTFVQSIKALPYVCLLIVMLFFIYAIIAMQIFGNIKLGKVPDSAINRHNNFQNIFKSLILLFRCCTGEAWQLIMLACLGDQDCEEGSLLPNGECGSNFAYIYFTSFVFLSSFLMLNLFVAVIMDNFDYLTRDASILGPHHLDEFIRGWAEYDPAATSRIHYTDMYEMLKKMEPPVGFGKNCPYRFAYRKLIRMNIPVSKNLTVHFRTTLFALIRETLHIQCGPVEQMNECDKELRKVIQNLWPVQSKKMLDILVPPDDDLMHDKLTTGKIYAGQIILENWRAYKECMLRGEKGPKPKILSMFNFDAIETSQSDSLFKRGWNILRRHSKATKSPNKDSQENKVANKFQALIDMAKQAEEKAGAKQLQASPKTPQLFDVVSKLREVGRPPVNSLSTIAEEGAASQIYSLPVSNAHGISDDGYMDDHPKPSNASDFTQMSSVYTNVHVHEDTNVAEYWDPCAYDIDGNRVTHHPEQHVTSPYQSQQTTGSIKKFARGQNWGSARLMLEEEHIKTQEQRALARSHKPYPDEWKKNIADAVLGMTTMAVSPYVLTEENAPQLNCKISDDGATPIQSGKLEAPYVERESAESPKDADFDHTDRPCSPPSDSRWNRTPRTPRKVSNLETVPELVSRSSSAHDDQNLSSYVMPKVSHNKDIGSIESMLPPTHSMSRLAASDARQHYDEHPFGSNISAASSLASVQTGEINANKPRPAPRRKDTSSRPVTPSDSLHSMQSGKQAPPTFTPRPRDRKRTGSEYSRVPTANYKENVGGTGAYRHGDGAVVRARANPFYNTDESDDSRKFYAQTGDRWDDEYYDSDRTLSAGEHQINQPRQGYHGRNALLDVDPRSIQHHPLSRQESFEQNDRSQDYELHERPAASSAYNTYHHKKANIIVTQGDDEEDGDWC